MRPERILIPDTDIVQAYQETKSTLKVARMFGIGQTTVQERLYKSGVKCDGRAHMGGGKKRVAVSDDEIIAAYHELRSPRKVAERFNIGAGTVERRLQRHGVKRIGQRGVPRKLPLSIVAEYEAGSSMNQIARNHSVCLATVAESLHRAGVTARKRIGMRSVLSADMKAKVVALYAEHKSQQRVASLVGIDQSAVSKYLRAAGLVVRPIGPRHGSWTGGRRVSKEGYVTVWVPHDDPMAAAMAQLGGGVLEHRLVLARHLNRPLERHETVHHINGDKTDNRVENLQLRQGRHGAGVVHRCCVCGSTNVETVKLN